LPPRAQALGWPAAASERLASARGPPAARADPRPGLQEALAPVTRGQGGRILACEATRLARHGSAWAPRRARCGARAGLRADRAGGSAPRRPHGRLWLGLQGQGAALARPPRRARLTAGLRTKAPRGARARPGPGGCGREARGLGSQAPHLAGQRRLLRGCAPCRPRRSARQGLRTGQAPQRPLPRRERWGAVAWRPPPVAALRSIVKPPASAGALPSGRPRPGRSGPGPPHAWPHPWPPAAGTVGGHEPSPAASAGEP
jgi:hypothetical protein